MRRYVTSFMLSVTLFLCIGGAHAKTRTWGRTRTRGHPFEYYNVSRDELYRSKRGQFNEPRNVAIYLTRKLRRDSLKEIGCQFQMEKYSSVSSIIERMKKQTLADRNLNKRVDRVADRVIKRQEQT